MTVQIIEAKQHFTQQTAYAFDDTILKKISVKPPYFALKKIRCMNDQVYAHIQTELCTSLEKGPMTTAEVGRHLAILGSLALARKNPIDECHHYLATDAVIRKLNTASAMNCKLIARAKTTLIDRKKGLVEGAVLDEQGNELFLVEVNYMVLKKSIFERMFDDKRTRFLADPSLNPYTKDVKLSSVKLGKSGCFAMLDTVKPTDCVGHFEDYPALPVARIGTAMGNLGGLHFLEMHPQAKAYQVKRAEIHARKLIFAGEEVFFRSEITETDRPDEFDVRVIASTSDADFVVESFSRYTL